MSTPSNYSDIGKLFKEAYDLMLDYEDVIREEAAIFKDIAVSAPVFETTPIITRTVKSYEKPYRKSSRKPRNKFYGW